MPSSYNGDDFFAGIRRQIASGVAAAAEDVKATAKQLTSTQGPPRSLPGNPPHKDTGELYASVEAIGPADDGDLIVASVGTSIPYGLYLEMGTSRMAARPWLGRALRQRQSAIARQIIRAGQQQGTMPEPAEEPPLNNGT